MTSVCVGNDIVDLGNPRTRGRASDERFMERVCADSERGTVAGAGDAERADLELWCHWAAKEAGYKVVSKLVGQPPPFVHRAFTVEWLEAPAPDDSVSLAPGDGRRIRRGFVSWGEHTVPVSVALHPGGVHAVASAPRAGRSQGPTRVHPRVALVDTPASPWAGSLEELVPRLTEREADAVHSLASAAVRVGARSALASLLHVEERRLEIVCGPGRPGRRPPRVLLDGRKTEADVSLSHDGPLIAWAIWAGDDQHHPGEDDS